LRFVPIAAFTLLAASPASAAWQRASSPHFIIYADESAAKLKAFAEKLERFDQAVRITRSMKDPPVGDGNRLTVFVVSGPVEVQKLHPGVNNRVNGFYRTSATGSIAVVPRSVSRGSIETPDVIFFHEYAHHLMFQEIDTPIRRGWSRGSPNSWVRRRSRPTARSVSAARRSIAPAHFIGPRIRCRSAQCLVPNGRAPAPNAAHSIRVAGCSPII